MVIRFADLSHHQNTVDLVAYTKAGHDRVFMKATQGRTGVDITFSARWKQAGQLGLARGAYHFAEAEDNGAADFDHFIAVVAAAGGYGSRDLLCLDSEDSPDINRADEHAREFTNRAAATGHPNGSLYTGRWFADPANLQPDDLAPGWRRLWLSDYGTAADNLIRLPAGWSRDQVIARQFTDAATVPGVAGASDYNRVLRDWIADMPVDKNDVKLIAAELATNQQFLLAVRGQLITVLADQTHAYLQDELAPIKERLDRVLAGLEMHGLTEDQIRAAVTEALESGTVDVNVTVHGSTPTV